MRCTQKIDAMPYKTIVEVYAKIVEVYAKIVEVHAEIIEVHAEIVEARQVYTACVAASSHARSASVARSGRSVCRTRA